MCNFLGNGVTDEKEFNVWSVRIDKKKKIGNFSQVFFKSTPRCNFVKFMKKENTMFYSYILQKKISENTLLL